MRLPVLFLSGLLALSMMEGCMQKQPDASPSPLAARIARFAPAVLTSDTLFLSGGERQALRHLAAAARIMDTLYLRQVWSGNEALLRHLEADRSPAGRERLEMFAIERSPWSSLDGDEPFVEGVPSRPPHAAHYPDDMTREEFEQWLASLSGEERARATGFFTAIRRGPDGRLRAVPYAEEYRGALERASALLREAAAATENVSLRRFLELRAAAFLSNDYYESDIAWMDTDSRLEVTIGPYETYMDRLFNYKAAFEAFIAIRNEQESRRLQEFSAYLQEIEDHLPLPSRYRNPRIGASAPIRVVDLVAAGGEAGAGVQTAAFNLPNDERVTREKGNKRVMLKNVQEAKFNTVLVPIARIALDSSLHGLVAFEPFFTHILAHELVHGLGPQDIAPGGRKSTVRLELKDRHAALEEAKADIGGLFALGYLAERGVFPPSGEPALYATFLAGMFRSIRFGIHEAHGKGMALQFNYLMEAGAIRYDRGTFSLDGTRMKKAVADLTGMIMTVQAEGDYAAAGALLDRYARMTPPMQEVLDRLGGIPVDIRPRYPLAEGPR
ncbi:MAG: hypothetical protein WB626_04115 [Bacteroidota bacterium]